MKIGILSVMIGMIGLTLITYFNYQANALYEELGELQEAVTIYPMGSTTRGILFFSETVGAIFGFLAYKRKKIKAGLLGMGLCALCLIFLYYPFF
jgi:hypothetical protein